MRPVGSGTITRLKILHRRLTGVAMGLTLLVSCSGGGSVGPTTPVTPVPPPRVLTTMTISVSATTIQVGQTVSATATGFDQYGTAMSIGIPAWTSNLPEIASVSANGLVTAVAPGQTTVIGTIGDVQGHVTLTITPLPPGPGPEPVATVSVSPLSASVAAGGTLQLTATPKDAAGRNLTDRAVTWTTSAPSVAMVSVTGLVATLGEGMAIIEATSEGKRGALALTVTTAVDTEIVVSIGLPVDNIPVGDTMDVVAAVRSRYPITSVVASVGGKQAAMTFGRFKSVRVPVWATAMDLSSFRFGNYDVVVTATDSRGHRGVTSKAFYRNPLTAGGGGKAPPANKQLQPAVRDHFGKPDTLPPA